MCGIIGYIGEGPTSNILLEGLHRLEYRGYDSAGLAIKRNGSLTVKKAEGEIKHLEAVAEGIEGDFGIAHTRWATHGKPSVQNAHPHTSTDGKIAVVHNGIIENHTPLKEMLKEKGYSFQSETDTEVLAHLLDYFYEGGFREALIDTLQLIEGTFGIAAIHTDHNHILAARRGSPLLIGLGENRNFIASDPTAILEHTNKVIYLKDDELTRVTRDGYEITTLQGVAVDSEVEELNYTAQQIAKGDYKHFMLKEINEQPEALRNTLRGRLLENHVKISVDLDLKQVNRIIITACGSSWHAALVGKFLLEKLAGIPVEVDYASEFRYRDPIIRENDLIIVISQSGETADTLAALREAKKRGAKSLGIVNVVGSTITREVDSGIYLHAGPEIGVASTKAFTSQITALILLSLHVRQELALELPQELLRGLRNLPVLVERSLDVELKEVAAKYKDVSNALYLGRGINYPVALEGALKLKEISYIHAEGYPAAEMKHGPIALIEEGMPVICIAVKDHTFEKVKSNMEEIKARDGDVIVITDAPEELRGIADHVVGVPKTHPLLSPILASLPLQILAYHIADMRGLNVDKPRNLAKSVTVE